MPKKLETHKVKRLPIKPEETRGSAAERGYDRRWRKMRAAFLAQHPMCENCLDHKKVTLAEVVDHITPHRGDVGLFWDQGNWQSLCKTCHAQKTGKGL